MLLPPARERDFVSTHIGPVLARDHPLTKIFVFDHNEVRIACLRCTTTESFYAFLRLKAEAALYASAVLRCKKITDSGPTMQQGCTAWLSHFWFINVIDHHDA